MNSPFVHLHCHSNYSFLYGAMSIDDILDRTRATGMSSIALTDNNGLYGAIPFYKKAVALGIKPLLGARIDDPEGDDTAIIIARNNKGFARLCRLVTDRRLEKGFRLKEALAGLGADLFVLTSSPDLLHILAGRRPPGTTYAEVCNMLDAASAGELSRLHGICEHTGLQAVATNNVHFRDRSDHELQKILSAIREKKVAGDLRDADVAPAEAWLKPPHDMRRLFKSWPSALRNTCRIAAECDVTFDLNRIRLPVFSTSNGEVPFSRLWKLCFRGLTKRYRPLNREAIDRLNSELNVIDALGFAPYFLLVWDIIRFAREKRIPWIGRGSAANSIVSYVLGITEIDPVEQNLFFERFLNPERSSPPDIDIDFCWKRRDRVLEYVYDKYGADRVAMISTHVTFRGRSAVREVGRAMGLPPEEISAFTSGIPYCRRLDVEWMRENHPKFRALPFEREPYPAILKLAERITGYPRHLSVHPGGIVVSPSPLLDLVPLERSRKGLVVTQYDMFSIEDLGLVKIDLLCQRSLSVLADTLEMLERNGSPVPHLEKREEIQNDKATRRLIRDGRTMGCFYIESPAMRSLLKKLKVDDFQMLTAASSVIRPGVAESGMMRQFIECHNGLREPSFLHPLMRSLLDETYGVMIYQEDVIKVAHQVAGMSLGEADLLRRAMSGKMRSHDAMERLQKRFTQGALNNGLSDKAADEIWRQMESFAGYAFCKAHSASYALLSFKVAYLKAHHPAEFLAAVITNRGGFYHHTAYIEEARRLGIRILPPDINRSDIDFTARGGEIRTGLMQIKGLSSGTLRRIAEARKAGGVFSSLRDFCERTNADLSDTEQLIRAGAFASIGMTRPELLWHLYLIFRERRAGGSSDDKPVFEEIPGMEKQIISVPGMAEYPLAKRLALELDTIGYNVDRHPLQAFKYLYRTIELTRAADLCAMAGKEVQLLGWVIASKRVGTRNGRFMEFLSLEDLTDTFEVVLFPGSYQKYGAILRDRGPYLISGTVLEESGCCTVTVDKIATVRSETRSANSLLPFPWDFPRRGEPPRMPR